MVKRAYTRMKGAAMFFIEVSVIIVSACFFLVANATGLRKVDRE